MRYLFCKLDRTDLKHQLSVNRGFNERSICSIKLFSFKRKQNKHVPLNDCVMHRKITNYALIGSYYNGTIEQNTRNRLLMRSLFIFHSGSKGTQVALHCTQVSYAQDGSEQVVMKTKVTNHHRKVFNLPSPSLREAFLT